MKIDIFPVVNQIIMLLILLCLGLMLRKLHVFTDAVIKGINALMITVTWPALMISTTQKDYSDETLQIFLTILLISVVLLTLANLVMFFLFRRKNKDTAQLMAMLSVMPNVGYFGIPIVDALYGSTGLLLLTAYITGFNFVLWTVTIFTFNGFSLKTLRNLLNPGIVCSLIGISLFLLKIALPTPLLSTVNQLSAVNTPLSMLILGARMDTLRLPDLADRKLWLVTGMKLVVFPLLVLALLRPMGITGMALVLLVVVSGMPAAASSQMLTERYGGDVYFSAKGTSVSTLCSLLSLPLILYITGLWA